MEWVQTESSVIIVVPAVAKMDIMVENVMFVNVDIILAPKGYVLVSTGVNSCLFFSGNENLGDS